MFFGKCGYCESRLAHIVFGDADHFRPKGRVRVRNGDVLEIIRCADGDEHPGYYWLAYDWGNIVPACPRCNSEGKKDQFPTANGHVCDPAGGNTSMELDATERPLLINPYRDDPAAHLIFGEQGVVAPLNASLRGEISIEVFGLSREPLRIERQEAQSHAWLEFLHAANDDTHHKVLTECVEGGRAYGVAVLDFLRHKVATLNRDVTEAT